MSALAVSDSGDFVATGSMFDGTVEIYIAYNLRVSKSNLRKMNSYQDTTTQIVIVYLKIGMYLASFQFKIYISEIEEN